MGEKSYSDQGPANTYQLPPLSRRLRLFFNDRKSVITGSGRQFLGRFGGRFPILDETFKILQGGGLSLSLSGVVW